MMSEISWIDLKKIKLSSFRDNSGKLCWTFYYNDLFKLANKKRNKRAEASNRKIILSMLGIKGAGR